MGDLNIDCCKCNCNYKIKQYVDDITRLGCDQLVDVLTRVTTHSQTILDHIYVNDNISSK